ncbi:MAG: DUF2442 domain-containing protein [Planctomycetaceae bacterium]|nr:DUF2442 domain-containing protein [Planctomycetaceae bacterium]
MTSSTPRVDPRAVDVATDDANLTVEIADGRRLTVPLGSFPRLLHATADRRGNWRPLGNRQGIHWTDIDEDLSVSGLLSGTAAPGASRRAV